MFLPLLLTLVLGLVSPSIISTSQVSVCIIHPYHFNPVQPLLERDRQPRSEFCEWLINKVDDEPRFLRKILWTDEATFTRNCGQCKMMLGAYFKGPTCARACLATFGKSLPDCNNPYSVKGFLKRLI